MLACPVISLINWRRPQDVTVQRCLLRSRRAAQSDLDSHAHQSTRNSAAGELTRPLPLESVPQKIGAPEMKDLRCGYAPERGRVASRGRWMDGDLPRQRETPAAGTTALRYGNRRVRNACESGAGAEPRQLTWEGARSEVQTESVRCPRQLALLLLLAPKYFMLFFERTQKLRGAAHRRLAGRTREVPFRASVCVTT